MSSSGLDPLRPTGTSTLPAELHLSDVQVSLAQGLAASLPAAVLSLPLGRLVDRANRTRPWSLR